MSQASMPLHFIGNFHSQDPKEEYKMKEESSIDDMENKDHDSHSK